MIIEKLDSLAALLALKEEWRALEVHSGLPFASWDWAVAWWTQLREDKLGVKDSLFARAFRSDQGELVAVAPLLISRRPSVGPLCMRQLQFFGADPNITELRGMIALPEWRKEAHRALLAHVREEADHWDSMLLSGLPMDFDAAELSPFPEFHWGKQVSNFQLPLPATWDEFRAALPRNIKESLRKCVNAPKRDGLALKLVIAERPAEVEQALSQFFVFHRARALRADTVRHGDVFDTAEARWFLLDVCRRFAETGRLRIFQLVLDQRVVAVRIGFVVGEVLYLYYSGYDEAFAKYSVMTTTVAEAIKYAIASGFKTVNLSTGSDISKTRWNPLEVTTRQALLVSPSRRAEVAHHVYQQALSAIDTVPALRRAMGFLARRPRLSPG